MKILVADDDNSVRLLLERRLRKWGYDVVSASDGLEAIKILKADDAPRLAVLDWVMPEIDGVDVCQFFKNSGQLTYFILMTGKNSEEDMINAIDMGAHNFLSKPISFPILKRFIDVGMRLVKAEEELKAEEAHIRMRCYEAIANLAEYRDEETGMHMKRLNRYSATLARAIGQPEQFIKDIDHFAALHDIGKVGIPDNVLLAPRKLSFDEFEVMKSHSTLGFQILADVPTLSMAADIAHYHHEKWNGKGYPAGLSGEEIPLAARITAVADVYDALRSVRPYKDPWTHKAACDLIASEKGLHFDPLLVEKFLENEKVFENLFNEYQDNHIESNNALSESA